MASESATSMKAYGCSRTVQIVRGEDVYLGDKVRLFLSLPQERGPVRTGEVAKVSSLTSRSPVQSAANVGLRRPRAFNSAPPSPVPRDDEPCEFEVQDKFNGVQQDGTNVKQHGFQHPCVVNLQVCMFLFPEHVKKLVQSNLRLSFPPHVGCDEPPEEEEDGIQMHCAGSCRRKRVFFQRLLDVQQSKSIRIVYTAIGDSSAC